MVRVFSVGETAILHWHASIRIDSHPPTVLAGTPTWSRAVSNLLIFPMFHDTKYFTRYEYGLWNSFFSKFETGTLNVLMRPDYEPAHGRTPLVLMHPELDVLTGAYDDVKDTLSEIKKHLVDRCGFQFVFLHGDQQSYSRMTHLMFSKGAEYNWLVPLPGEWHFVVHALISIHNPKSGWWHHFTNWFPRVARLSPDAIDRDWTSVEKYNNYCDFYECIIVSSMQYLHDIVPEYYLDHPVLLMELLEENKAEGT
jgi:hypothetical protein